MSTEYVGAIVLHLNGIECECTKFDVRDATGKKRVKTMNRTGRTRGFTRGIGDYDCSGTVVLPVDGTAIDWANVENAKLSFYPLGGGSITSYLDFTVEEVGSAYTVDNEAVIDVKGFALRKVSE